MSTTPALKRALGFCDLTLFYVVSGLSVRWVASAAAGGPSTLVVWVIALVGFFIPLAASVLELSSRYPQEGGLYVWPREAFGDFFGFYCRLDLLNEQPTVLSRRALLRSGLGPLRLWCTQGEPCFERRLLRRFRCLLACDYYAAEYRRQVAEQYWLGGKYRAPRCALCAGCDFRVALWVGHSLCS